MPLQEVREACTKIVILHQKFAGGLRPDSPQPGNWLRTKRFHIFLRPLLMPSHLWSPLPSWSCISCFLWHERSLSRPFQRMHLRTSRTPIFSAVPSPPGKLSSLWALTFWAVVSPRHRRRDSVQGQTGRVCTNVQLEMEEQQILKHVTNVLTYSSLCILSPEVPRVLKFTGIFLFMPLSLFLHVYVSVTSHVILYVSHIIKIKCISLYKSFWTLLFLPCHIIMWFFYAFTLHCVLSVVFCCYHNWYVFIFKLFSMFIL